MRDHCFMSDYYLADKLVLRFVFEYYVTDKRAVLFVFHYYVLYNKPSYSRIVALAYDHCIRGQTHD